MSDPLDPAAPALPPTTELYVCPNCGRTLAHDPAATSLRLAIDTDTKDLTAAEILVLKAQRPERPARA